MTKKITINLFIIIILCISSCTQAHSGEQRDHMKAFLFSLAVPGLGQYYAGSLGYAKIFIAVELAIWGGYYYNTGMMNASSQDYYSQAALHTGVNPSGFGTSYLNAIGAYNSSYDYNNRQLQSTFNPVLYSGKQTWEWDTEKNRLRFKYLRERELDFENNTKYCIAGIIFNHFLSALNASKLVQKKNGADSAVTVNVLDTGLALSYIRSF